MLLDLDCIRLTRLRLAVHRKVAPRTLCGQSQQILNDSWILHLSPRVWGFCTWVPRPRWVVLKPLAGVNPCRLHWSNDCKGCKKLSKGVCKTSAGAGKGDRNAISANCKDKEKGIQTTAWTEALDWLSRRTIYSTTYWDACSIQPVIKEIHLTPSLFLKLWLWRGILHSSAFFTYSTKPSFLMIRS